MISLTGSELFSVILLAAISYLAILAWRFQSRCSSHDWRLTRAHLFHCDNCHNAFVPKEPVNLCRCPRCNAICFRKKEL